MIIVLVLAANITNREAADMAPVQSIHHAARHPPPIPRGILPRINCSYAVYNLICPFDLRAHEAYGVYTKIF